MELFRWMQKLKKKKKKEEEEEEEEEERKEPFHSRVNYLVPLQIMYRRIL